jgi:hypothetical protein
MYRWQNEGEGRARTYFVVQFSHIELRHVTAEEMILGLVDDGRDAVELPTVGVPFHDFCRCPLGSTPVHGPTIVYDLSHGSNYFWRKGAERENKREVNK